MAITPQVTATLVKKGFKVNVETGAGKEAKFRDGSYKESGAHIVDNKTAFTSGKHKNALSLLHIFIIKLFVYFIVV